ncbi:YlqD family protein [Brevibacillus agri]|uniref:YlqD family protein n=1 Tax=Brevibacillus agri TaxID=51101 RepID=UPI002E2406E0|nr:YlqD family protein [Brevibacillus agri]MED1653446.1 YlqD family protein [Brevibacillus agri]MED1685313.1 YlqD family protein [Brevibacillus agri]MED1690678.1 YlqD family protein [Brevibacillus agri]MED1697515.1 YlqD family protein [Brevibacillus agri]
MLTIFRSVQVKLIMTEASRAVLIDQYSRQLRQQREEWEQWQFQAKKILAEAKKKSADTYALAQEKIAQEERRRKEKIAQLSFALQQAESLPEGSEMDYQTVQSPVTIQVGDVWDEIMAGTEIMIKDGRVHEIRQTAGHAADE